VLSVGVDAIVSARAFAGLPILADHRLEPRDIVPWRGDPLESLGRGGSRRPEGGKPLPRGGETAQSRSSQTHSRRSCSPWA
jgi:hypothetical protein